MRTAVFSDGKSNVVRCPVPLPRRTAFIVGKAERHGRILDVAKVKGDPAAPVFCYHCGVYLHLLPLTLLSACSSCRELRAEVRLRRIHGGSSHQGRTLNGVPLLLSFCPFQRRALLPLLCSSVAAPMLDCLVSALGEGVSLCFARHSDGSIVDEVGDVV